MPIEIKDLCLSYSQNNVLCNIDLNIDEGQMIGIIGQTGSGKTSLVQLIAGLIKPSSGTVLVDGDDIFDKKYDRAILRKKLGIVFQYPESQLFEQSVGKDIAFGLKKSGLSKSEKTAQVKWAMQLLNLDFEKIKDKSPLALSGGEKRKVAIAGVIVTKPKYLILDEPIAGLDPSSRNDFMKMLFSLKQSGTTVIMVSHNADCLAEYMDRIIVIDNGKIAMDSSPNEVYSRIDELKKMSLGTCTVKDICYKLSHSGIDISDEILKYDDLLNALSGYFTYE
jgi:energy-coupling factor transport system ATP-binding protein